MPATPNDRYQTALSSLEEMPIAEADVARIRELCAAFDESDATVDLPREFYEGRRTRFTNMNTRAAWIERLRIIGQDLQLTDTTTEEINTWTTKRLHAPDGPGRAQIQSIEYALAKFYRYHTDLDIDQRDIAKHQRDESEGWGPRDILDADERYALRTVADHPRDRVIVDLALYCGLRNTAIRTLRVRDIDLEGHEYYFNATANGLKDISEPKEPRPVFQAYRAIREWHQRHPTNEPSHYFVTQKPSWTRATPTAPLTKETIEQVMRRLKARTAERSDVITVGKPCHPHMLRHNFVTQCRRHPDITDDDIKFFIGHKSSSSVMERTYSHISPGERNDRGHTAFGADGAPTGDSDGPPPWDTTCKRCYRVLRPGESTCPECGQNLTASPWDDVRIDETLRRVDDFLLSAIADADPTDAHEFVELRRIIRDEPEAREPAIERILDRMD